MELVMNCKIESYRDATFPQFAQPNEVGHFSVGADQVLSFDAKQLNNLKMQFTEPKMSVEFDLNPGFYSHISKAEGMKSIRSSLR